MSSIRSHEFEFSRPELRDHVGFARRGCGTRRKLASAARPGDDHHDDHAPDAYLLAYALVTGLTRQQCVKIPIDLGDALARLQRQLPTYKAELAATPNPRGPMPEGKWWDLKRLGANTGVALIQPSPE